jgi:hypothetical protein
MNPSRLWTAALLLATCTFTCAQITRTSVPLGDAVGKALAQSSLTGDTARPFHIRVAISEPENPQSPYQGTIEEWWVSATQWRREVTAKDGLHQTIVVANGVKTEQDQGDYFPLWLRSFVTALFEPVPNPEAWKAADASTDQVILPNGVKSLPCAHLHSKIGSGDAATDAFSSVCFDSEGRLSGIVSPRYRMEFRDYLPFGNIQFPRQFVHDLETRGKLVGEVQVLEDVSRAASSPALFAPLPTTDDKFQSFAANPALMETLSTGNPPITWPIVRFDNTRGHIAVYISADSQGNVREVRPLRSDNLGLEGPVRDQILHWKLKPAADKTGKPLQVDGGLAFLFDIAAANSLPVLSGDQIAPQIKGNCPYNPVLPAGLLPSGTTFKIRVAVDEQGKETSKSYPPNIDGNVIFKTGFEKVRCNYKPYLVNGRPTYYFIDFAFTAP